MSLLTPVEKLWEFRLEIISQLQLSTRDEKFTTFQFINDFKFA